MPPSTESTAVFNQGTSSPLILIHTVLLKVRPTPSSRDTYVVCDLLCHVRGPWEMNKRLRPDQSGWLMMTSSKTWTSAVWSYIYPWIFQMRESVFSLFCQRAFHLFSVTSNYESYQIQFLWSRFYDCYFINEKNNAHKSQADGLRSHSI